MASEIDPWERVFAHRYSDALTQYDERRRNGFEQDALEIGNRSTALLCLGRLDEALAGFQQANELARQRLRGETQPYLAKIGAMFWLLGKRNEGIQAFKAAVDGILDGSIKFADNAGGVSEGLLLWYAAVTDANNEAKEHSLNYLRKLAKKPRIKNWPGDLALVALKGKSIDELLHNRFGTGDILKAAETAKSDLLKRRELVKCLFYSAVRKRDENDEIGCRNIMAACTSLENPIIEIEWFLARAEAAADTGGKS